MGKKTQTNKRKTNTPISKRNKRKKPETRTKNTRTTKNNSRNKCEKTLPIKPQTQKTQKNRIQRTIRGMGKMQQKQRQTNIQHTNKILPRKIHRTYSIPRNDTHILPKPQPTILQRNEKNIPRLAKMGTRTQTTTIPSRHKRNIPMEKLITQKQIKNLERIIQ